MFLDNCYFQLRIALFSFKVSVKKFNNLLICSLNFHRTNDFSSSSNFLCQARFQIYRVGSYKWPMMKIWAQNITSSWILFIYVISFDVFLCYAGIEPRTFDKSTILFPTRLVVVVASARTSARRCSSRSSSDWWKPSRSNSQQRLVWLLALFFAIKFLTVFFILNSNFEFRSDICGFYYFFHL